MAGKAAESVAYVATQDLFVGWAKAHDEGSEFWSTQEQVEKLGWKDGVKKLEKPSQSPGTETKEKAGA